MKPSANFYQEILYPFQDGILNIVKKSDTPFYLTGGTALSRHYFNHRFSDDLDLFVNSDPNYGRYVAKIVKVLEDNQKIFNYVIDYRRLRKEEHYAQLFLIQPENSVELKLDMINDVASHYGEYENSELIGRIDSWRNILSNKLAAVFRYEAKDFADIWIIAKTKRFMWRQMMDEAKTKEVGVDPIALFEIIGSVPAQAIVAVKWIKPIDLKEITADLKIIARDILEGRENTLFGMKVIS
jgi:hypothetical protein